MDSKITPKTLLDQYGLLPRKSLGQNFLNDPNALEKIVASADIAPGDTVLEIGAGTGALTEALAARAGRVIAVEIDARMMPVLARFETMPHVEVVYGDILALDVGALVGDAPYSVVANVPYYITSAILRHLLESTHRPQRLILTVQLEVAERLLAMPGDMSLLAVSAQFYGKPKLVMKLNRAVFYPRPDVDSAVIRIDVYPQSPVDIPDEATFFRVARAGFGQKRKQLRNALAEGLALPTATMERLFTFSGVDARRRAETLTLEEWAALARAYADVTRPIET